MGGAFRGVTSHPRIASRPDAKATVGAAPRLCERVRSIGPFVTYLNENRFIRSCATQGWGGQLDGACTAADLGDPDVIRGTDIQGCLGYPRTSNHPQPSRDCIDRASWVVRSGTAPGALKSLAVYLYDRIVWKHLERAASVGAHDTQPHK